MVARDTADDHLSADHPERERVGLRRVRRLIPDCSGAINSVSTCTVAAAGTRSTPNPACTTFAWPSRVTKICVEFSRPWTTFGSFKKTNTQDVTRGPSDERQQDSPVPEQQKQRALCTVLREYEQRHTDGRHTDGLEHLMVP